MDNKERIKELFFNISMLLYVASCIMPCLSTRVERVIGFQCLLMGALSFITDIWAFLIWSSNVLYITIVVNIFRGKDVRIILPVISSLLSLGMLFHKYLIYDTEVPIIVFHIGYYLWCASHLVLLLVCILKNIEENKSI